MPAFREFAGHDLRATMVFATLDGAEKQAFFNLLDEYFESRPQLLGQGSVEPAQVAAAVKKVADSPAAHSALNYANEHKADIASAVGRVAALSQSRSMPPPPGPPPASVSSTTAPPRPPPAPRRTTSSSDGPSGLVTQQRMGSVDTSSKSAAVWSTLKKSTPAKSTTTIPSAFAPRTNNFAPPPRRGTPASSPSSAAAATEPEQEWAEAIYDYTSDAKEDLNVSEGDRVVITERTSADWWTCELNGKSGLVPASYLKEL